MLRAPAPICMTSKWCRRDARDDVTHACDMHNVIQATISLLMVAKQLLRGPYLQNRWVDFVHFLHADWYGGAGSTMKLVWWSRVHHEKFSTIGSISEPWENFLISITTDGNFQIPFLRRRFRALRDCLCAIWSRSVENPGSRSRTNKQTNRRQTQIIVWWPYFWIMLK